MNSIQLAWENTYLLVLINLLFSRGLFLLFPPYVNQRFSPIPQLHLFNKANALLFLIIALYSLFLPFSSIKFYFATGISFYILGLGLMIVSIFFFAINEPDRIIKGGVYKISRHPVYLGTYFQICGLAIVSESLLIGILLIIHIFIQHKIILQEENDLENFYGKTYTDYIKKVKRYIFF